jgi:hypothetical protein
MYANVIVYNPTGTWNMLYPPSDPVIWNLEPVSPCTSTLRKGIFPNGYSIARPVTVDPLSLDLVHPDKGSSIESEITTIAINIRLSLALYFRLLDFIIYLSLYSVTGYGSAFAEVKSAFSFVTF